MTASASSQNNTSGNNNNTNNNQNVVPQNDPLSQDLNTNLNKIKDIFVYPANRDFIFRELHIKSVNRDAVIFFLYGMVKEEIVEEHVIEPLLVETLSSAPNEDLGSTLMKRIIQGKNVKKVENYKILTDEILMGNTLLLIQGYNKAISIGTTGYEHRAVEKPTNENTLKGPKEAFTESEQANRSLVRKALRHEKLVSESVRIGERAIDDVYVMYVKGLANQNLIDEVKRRINEVNVSSIQSLSLLEQYLEDRTYSIIPTILSTERPDRVVSFLLEGYVAIFMDGSPCALIAPVTFFSFFHNPEDQYQRWLYGNFIRLIRIISIFVALFTPGLYIAVSSYHIDMIPTDLVLAIAASREQLPFPAIIEVIIMELSFELLREAGVRIPTPIGPTIGIVGALILGQAAVQANVVSPILVIIVAITGLGSFAIPELSLSFIVRIGRFAFFAAGAFMGFYGVAACLTMSIAYISTVKSFGIPWLSPLSPHYRSSKDLFALPPVWKQWLRPQFLSPQDSIRRQIPKRK